MREIIMGYQGEMSLKGLNRNQFESAMMKILRYRLRFHGVPPQWILPVALSQAAVSWSVSA